jgi:hypothetical protein
MAGMCHLKPRVKLNKLMMFYFGETSVIPEQPLLNQVFGFINNLPDKASNQAKIKEEIRIITMSAQNILNKQTSKDDSRRLQYYKE